MKKQAYWMLAERRVLRDAKAVLFTSDHEERSAAATFWPAAHYRSRIVPLGVSQAPANVEPLRATFLKVFPHLRGRRFLLFLGRLHPKKGCDLLVRAMADLRPPIDLVLAGPSSSPAHKESLRRSAAGLPITFIGMIQGDLKAGALALAEALILPSHQENFGLAVAEALSFGTPALVSTQVNIEGSIRSFGAGFVEPDTLIGTRRLIERWLQTGGAAMRTAALRCFRQRFDIENSAAEFLEILTGHP